MGGEPTTIFSNGGDEVITEPGSRMIQGRIAVHVRPSVNDCA